MPRVDCQTTEDGKVPPTRTLVTKDGKATFVELQTVRSDTKHFYTYQSTPLPVTHYTSTIKVAAKSKGIPPLPGVASICRNTVKRRTRAMR